MPKPRYYPEIKLSIRQPKQPLTSTLNIDVLRLGLSLQVDFPKRLSLSHSTRVTSLILTEFSRFEQPNPVEYSRFIVLHCINCSAIARTKYACIGKQHFAGSNLTLVRLRLITETFLYAISASGLFPWESYKTSSKHPAFLRKDPKS